MCFRLYHCVVVLYRDYDAVHSLFAAATSIGTAVNAYTKFVVGTNEVPSSFLTLIFLLPSFMFEYLFFSSTD
jgi:hypothetical protein